MVKNYMQKLQDSLYTHEQELEEAADVTMEAMEKFVDHLQTYKNELQIDKNFIL